MSSNITVLSDSVYAFNKPLQMQICSDCNAFLCNKCAKLANNGVPVGYHMAQLEFYVELED